MDSKNLKYVVGQVIENKPAAIRFYDSVDKWSVDAFKEEFLWLQDYVKPSKIVVLINSDGGSVVHGMAAFSLIAECPIETACVIEGIAASMGSVIWAAGKNLYMHDYSILMIHNPFIGYADAEDPNIKAIVDAFKEQLKTVYMKRFGLSEEEVTAIMDGVEGVDGTYLNANEVVSRGIIPADHVIQTSQSAKAAIEDELRQAMETHCAVDFQKISAKVDTIDPGACLNALGVVIENETKPTQTIQMNQEFQAVASLLGLDATSATVLNVQNKITELINAQTDCEKVKAERDGLKGEILAKDTTISNLQANIDQLTAELKTFKDAEEARKQAEITAKIEAAVKAGKIAEDAKAQWEEFFKGNPALAESSLDAIPARVIVTDQIAGDPQAQQDAEAKQKALEEAQKKAEEAIAQIVGDDFKFNSFAPKED